MLLMSWGVMARVHLRKTVAFASGGLGSAEAWFIDNPVVSATTLTIQSQTNGQVDDDGPVNVQHSGKFLVVALMHVVSSWPISWSIYTHHRLTYNEVLMQWLANHNPCQVGIEKKRNNITLYNFISSESHFLPSVLMCCMSRSHIVPGITSSPSLQFRPALHTGLLISSLHLPTKPQLQRLFRSFIDL